MVDVHALACPDCAGGSLCPSPINGCFSYSCPDCRGQFVEHALLAELLDQRVEARDDMVRKHRTTPNPLRQAIRYRPCAVCRELMNRKNFGGASGVIVDVCPLHGMWFEVGELESVLSFVRQGGLARAERLRAERARHEGSSNRLSKATLPVYSAAREATIDPTSIADLGQGLIELVEFLHDVLTAAHPPERE